MKEDYVSIAASHVTKSARTMNTLLAMLGSGTVSACGIPTEFLQEPGKNGQV